MSTRDLAMDFRGQARVFREHAQESIAIAYERCAQRLEDLLRSEAEQLLTLPEAARLSGYSADHLGRLVREGTIPNAGRPGSPRIARGDVPVKPGIVALDHAESDLSRTQIVRSAITEGAA